MSGLAALIRSEIGQTGPMSVARYMELCLAHPVYGYYRNRNPIGAGGDFTTAPEISQMFGEIIGAWIVAAWRGMGEPEFKLVELGPGRGTLMADVLRVLDAAGAREAAEIWLVEMSPALRAEQANRVPGAHWVDRIEDVPMGPTILVANEFFDALPVRQFLCASDGWRERVVGAMGDQLIWGLSAPMDQGRGEPGAWTEISPQTESVSAAIAKRLRAGPGAALMIDYGYQGDDRPKGPTLQAVRGHEHADPLQEPGQSDLTWLVDFDSLAGVFHAAGHKVAVTEQGAFLTALGIGHRAAALAETEPDQAEGIADALERLTDPAQMGKLFKVLSAVSIGLPQPPGFDDEP